jgi:hypothetical protein
VTGGRDDTLWGSRRFPCQPLFPSRRWFSAMPKCHRPGPVADSPQTTINLRFLSIADACTKPGALLALLRREGLCSSNLARYAALGRALQVAAARIPDAHKKVTRLVGPTLPPPDGATETLSRARLRHRATHPPCIDPVPDWGARRAPHRKSHLHGGSTSSTGSGQLTQLCKTFTKSRGHS